MLGALAKLAQYGRQETQESLGRLEEYAQQAKMKRLGKAFVGTFKNPEDLSPEKLQEFIQSTGASPDDIKQIYPVVKQFWKQYGPLQPLPGGGYEQRDRFTNEAKVKIEPETPKEPLETWNEPYEGPEGSLLQRSSRGKTMSVLGRKPAEKEPLETWNESYEGPEGSVLQQSSRGKIASVLGRKPDGSKPTSDVDKFTKLEALLYQLGRTDDKANAALSKEQKQEIMTKALKEAGISVALPTRKNGGWEAFWERVKEAIGFGGSEEGSPRSSNRRVVKTGTHKGRKVVQYDDGSIEYDD